MPKSGEAAPAFHVKHLRTTAMRMRGRLAKLYETRLIALLCLCFCASLSWQLRILLLGLGHF